MRGAFVSVFVPSATLYFLVACIPSLSTGDDATAATTTDASTVTSDAGYVGGGCGPESTTGQQLCIATTMCPTLVVNTQTMPHCGFRIRNGVADLVCACATSICSMGVFNTCAEASNLLLNQSESDVCAQVSENRCADTATAVPASSSSTTSSSSSSTTSSGGIGCDQQCVKDCGGGEACASVCNCN